MGARGFSRREFLGTAAASFATSPLARIPAADSGGVRIGAITYSWRSMPTTPEDIIRYCKIAGIGTLELMGNVAENYAGIPQAQSRKPTPEDLTARRTWRVAQPMDKFQELRGLFDDAGIGIHIAKFSPANWTGEEIDYSFRAAKALGASGVCDEIGETPCRRLAPFAEKHGMYAIFHQHRQPAEPGFSFETFLAYSPAIMLNFDVGHYFGCTGLHPNRVIEKLHDRIVSLHLKDFTGPRSAPPDTNRVWGKGETPLVDILRLIQKQKWPIYCDVELEYDVPAGSDAAQEVRKCVEFAKAALA